MLQNSHPLLAFQELQNGPVNVFSYVGLEFATLQMAGQQVQGSKI